MTGTPPLSAEDDLLAAEYVLGVLDAEAWAAAQLRTRREPGFAEAVSAWESRLAAMNDGFAEVPAPDLLPQIEARLFPVAAPPRRRFGWFGLGAGLVAAGLAAVVLLTSLPVAPPPLLTTLATTGLAYEVRADGRVLRVTRIAGVAAPAGQVHELWVIAPGAAPVSLGLLGEGPLELAYPVPPAGWTLAVSVEPAGGSATGAPTGPVILAQEIGA